MLQRFQVHSSTLKVKAGEHPIGQHVIPGKIGHLRLFGWGLGYVVVPLADTQRGDQRTSAGIVWPVRTGERKIHLHKIAGFLMEGSAFPGSSPAM